MRLIGALSLVFTLALSLAIRGEPQATSVAHETSASKNADQLLAQAGKWIFRFDTFGDEQFWTDVLRMDEAVAQVDPETALGVGLKVDVKALPASVIAAIRADDLDLKNPAVTIELLRLNAVVGVRGRVNDAGQLTSLGVTCALCHSTVDNSLTTGIGRRLDGWANTDLDVGKIVALSPALGDLLKEEFRQWGPGMYDPRHHAFDGTNIIPLNSPSRPVVIPPIYGLKGVLWETYTGDGPISYWNRYVGVGQMGGQGSFRDPRINLTITQSPDRVAPKLRALLEYQLSLRTPDPPARSFDPLAAQRGGRLFRHRAGCARCHQGPNFTDVQSGPDPRRPFLHDPAEVGMDAEYADRSATGKYRTTPLRALWQHAPYFHDGSAPDLLAVVNHYNRRFRLRLTEAQKADLVEFLKSI